MDKYLVMVEDGYTGDTWPDLMTAGEIIHHIDMSDCSNENLVVYRLAFDKEPELLDIWPCWHKFSDPLYIKVTDANGDIVFDGYGEDH